MAEITITNKNLVALSNFLGEIAMPAMVARKNRNLIKTIKESIESLSEQEKEIAESLGGQVSPDGTIDFSKAPDMEKSTSEFVTQREGLLNEDKSIIRESIDGSLAVLYTDCLATWNGNLKPEYNEAYNELMDQLEELVKG